MSLSRDLAEALAADARLVILRELVAQTDGRLNDLMLQKVLDVHGYRRDRDWVKTQLRKLEALDAVSLLGTGTMLIARIERPGRDHVEERTILSGVSRPAEVE